MDPITALHTLARRHCIDRITHFQSIFSTPAATQPTILNARISILSALLRDTEQFEPADFSSLADLRNLLATAATSATNQFLPRMNHADQRAAIADERAQFAELASTADPSVSPAPLPFRKVLSTAQHAQLHNQFASLWSRWGGGMPESKTIPPHVTLHTAAMDTAGAYDLLAQTLASRNITRLYELREWGDGYLLDLPLANFQYTGAEGFWTSPDMSWMVYASHEASITFGAQWLIDAMQSQLPHFHHYLYKSYDLDAYGPPP